jgi:hypothetical protein
MQANPVCNMQARIAYKHCGPGAAEENRGNPNSRPGPRTQRGRSSARPGARETEGAQGMSFTEALGRASGCALGKSFSEGQERKGVSTVLTAELGGSEYEQVA